MEAAEVAFRARSLQLQPRLARAAALLQQTEAQLATYPPALVTAVDALRLRHRITAVQVGADDASLLRRSKALVGSSLWQH